MIHISTTTIYLNTLAMFILTSLGFIIDNETLIWVSSFLFGIYFCLASLRYQGIA